jgi:hypothetical protein
LTFVRWTQEHLGEVRVDYAPQSYIGVRRGRRVWAPLWLRTDGAAVYLPDPDGSREEHPSVAFEYFLERLRDAGLEPSWQRTYNAGANPISVRLRLADLEKQEVQELLRASFEILELGTNPFSERRAAEVQAQTDSSEDADELVSGDHERSLPNDGL